MTHHKECRDLITESETATICGLSVFQLRRRRQDKKPPTYHKVNGKVYYERSVIQDLSISRTRASPATIFDGKLPNRDKIKRLSAW